METNRFFGRELCAPPLTRSGVLPLCLELSRFPWLLAKPENDGLGPPAAAAPAAEAEAPLAIVRCRHRGLCRLSYRDYVDNPESCATSVLARWYSAVTGRTAQRWLRSVRRVPKRHIGPSPVGVRSQSATDLET